MTPHGDVRRCHWGIRAFRRGRCPNEPCLHPEAAGRLRGVIRTSAAPTSRVPRLRRPAGMLLVTAGGWIAAATVLGHGSATAVLPAAPASTATPDEATWALARPILESRCLPCHGGDSVRGGLRLATAETFRAGGDRGPLIDPDAPTDPARSHLAEVLGYENPEFAMPPSGRLPQAEIDALLAWAAAGAPWPEGEAGRLADPDLHAEADAAARLAAAADWWAYRPLSDAPPPVAADPAWNRHPVDAFIHHGLEAAGLTPAPPAEPAALLRRARLDLTGLPPSPEEQDAFLAAWAADPEAAWTALVDRLLEEPAHGEHLARQWLDLVRYAETNGYERDSVKPNIWRYRDWVVRAINDDLPYDRFVIEQLAGDELAEWAPELVTDPRDPGPRIATGFHRLMVWDDEPADRLQARADELADLVDTTGQVFMGVTMGCARCHDHKADPITQADYFAMTAWFNNVRPYGGEHLLSPVADRAAPGVPTSLERDGQVAAIESDLRPLLEQLRRIEAEAGLAPPPRRVLVRDAAAAMPDRARWRYHLGDPPPGWTIPSFDDSAWAEGAGGFAQGGAPGARPGTEWTGPRIQIRTRFGLESIPESLVLRLHHDEDAEVFLNGVRVFAAGGYRVEPGEFQLGPEAIDALVVGANVLAVSCVNTLGPGYLDAGLRTGRTGEDDPRAWLAELEARGPERLPEPAAAELARGLAQRRQLLESPVAEAYPAMVVTEHGPHAPPQPILLRGSAHAPGDIVEPAVPAVLAWAGTPEVPAPRPEARTTGRRLAFARWLVEEADFLVARVAANRLWQQHFGRGLARSPGDFGRLGQGPTHPQLLDHLARRLIELDWSMKAMRRELLATRAYRMSSVPSEAALASDPLNDRIARRDPRRLTAEQYRDAVLAAAGRLRPGLGGPSVYPPLPAEALASSSRPDAAWGRSEPEQADRRTLYVHVKRSLPVPLLAALDQPSPDTVCPERFPTNVPTQSLITLNGEFVQQAAADMADRLLRETDSAAAAIDRGIRLAFGRTAGPGERRRHEAFLERLADEHGLSPRDAMAAWCLFLFNANEFLWLD